MWIINLVQWPFNNPFWQLAKQYASPERVWGKRTVENVHKTYKHCLSDTAWRIPGSSERLTNTECTWQTDIENKPRPQTLGRVFLWQSKLRLAVLAIQHIFTCTEINTSYIINALTWPRLSRIKNNLMHKSNVNGFFKDLCVGKSFSKKIRIRLHCKKWFVA